MSETYALVLKDETCSTDILVWSESVFLVGDNTHLQYAKNSDEVLRYLVSSIRRNPKNLLAHLQRITFCYAHKYQQSLYAALVDFFIVLENAGLAIKKRMLGGAKKQLPLELFNTLSQSLTDHKLIIGNRFTVLTTGCEVNTVPLLIQGDPSEHAILNHDPLQIARDFIEFSQLDEAMGVLESAILEDPQRDELHNDLLELYQSTAAVEAFAQMKLSLLSTPHSMQEEWDKLETYFNQ